MSASEAVLDVTSDAEPKAALERLSQCETPLLIGVRHHSPACSAAVPAILDRFHPDRLLLELPPELGGWIRWLGHPELKAPVALAGVRSDGSGLAFYPFADFSPELAAVRWAQSHDLPVEAFDLPLQRRQGDVAPVELKVSARWDEKERSLLGMLMELENATDSESLWDQLVEARAPGADAERIRRASLLYGWALRVDAARKNSLSLVDLRREAFMRDVLERTLKRGERVVAIVGAFHGSALLPKPLLWQPPEETEDLEATDKAEIVASLIPYAFELLDSRSGYPAGIRDPLWQQHVFGVLAGGDRTIEDELTSSIVDVCRTMRGEGHVASAPDAHEATRVAFDLARLRGLPSPGRRELLEALHSALSQGELLGRGRVLARALERVMVGRRRGRLARGTPRSGLAPHVDALLEELKLPGPSESSADAVTLRLDPFRSTLDRRRHVALQRLALCGVPYGTERVGTAAGGVETLTRVWNVSWSPNVEAMIELAGIRGVTLRQAAEGALRADRSRLEEREELVARRQLALLGEAAEGGLADFVAEGFEMLMEASFLDVAGLAELIDTLGLVDRVVRGHVPGLPQDERGAVPGELDRFVMPPVVRTSELLSRAISALDGLSGSERLEDARAMLDLVKLVQRPDARLAWALERLALDGSGLIQGAAVVLRVMLGLTSSHAISTLMESWVDGATDDGGRRLLAARLQGALIVSGPLFEADETFHQGLLDRVDQIPDASFLERLPALREGFDVLSPAARSRLLAALGERLGEIDPRGRGLDVLIEDSPELLARFVAADQAGRHALAQLGVALPAVANSTGVEPLMERTPSKAETPEVDAATDLQISPKDRWRLILGQERDKLHASNACYARALDELYGSGRGEGSRGFGAGKEAPFPTAREWSEELEDLFGTSVREEVLGRAVVQGRTSALLTLDPEEVTPSVELLEQVLSLKGGLPEAHLGRLRRLIDRVIDELVKELAKTVTPALTGLTSPRPTTRPTGALDLRRTIAANLKTLRPIGDDEVQIVPERLIFRSRARRSLEHHIILVVDVSGSMEPSVIYSAMMAAILSGLPALKVSFLTFSTEVIDLSERVDDPLGLLLEVSVGGGTHIAKALRAARAMVTVPARTIVVVVTDFEEGYSAEGLIGEVRALVETGATALGLAALDDRGEPRYSKAIAELVVNAGMPVAALTPLELARWVGEQIR